MSYCADCDGDEPEDGDEVEADARFEEGDTVKVDADYREQYEVLCNSAGQEGETRCLSCHAPLYTGEFCETPLRFADGEFFTVISFDWENGGYEYNLMDNEGCRVWSVKEDDLRVR